MTATSYVDLDNDDLGANKILRAATASALDTNPVSIAQRGTGAPWLNGVGAITSITSGSGNWTVLGGVYRIKVTAIGGGGGGGQSGGGGSGTSGGNTTFGALTANGGAGGSNAGGTASGGTASGGEINFSGGTGGAGGIQTIAGSSMFGNGGGYGAGGFGITAGCGGGGGGVSIDVLSIEPGELIAYAVGAAGGGPSPGASGIIIIEY